MPSLLRKVAAALISAAAGIPVATLGGSPTLLSDTRCAG